MTFTLVVHGGAGTIRAEDATPVQQEAYRAALLAALAAGGAVLSSGGSALDAVEAAVRCLEDCPLFNAGRGSTFTTAGTIEMDAAVMDGATGLVGAVASGRRIRNPVTAACAVAARTRHVLLVSEGADAFAEREGLELAPAEWFRTQHRWDQLEAARARELIVLDDDLPARMGTVGAVARDQTGRLAAATSTGGMTNKHAGRVGDSPLPGAGTWAYTAIAVSCTGTGEAFIRCAAAHELSALVRHCGRTIQQAADEVALQLVPAAGGDGGLIAVDATGTPALAFGTAGMYRGVLREGGAPEVAIWQ